MYSMLLMLQVPVLRDGEVQDISIFDLLVGDVMLFETGDILPADAIIFTGHGIRFVSFDTPCSFSLMRHALAK